METRFRRRVQSRTARTRAQRPLNSRIVAWAALLPPRVCNTLPPPPHRFLECHRDSLVSNSRRQGQTAIVIQPLVPCYEENTPRASDIFSPLLSLSRFTTFAANLSRGISVALLSLSLSACVSEISLKTCCEGWESSDFVISLCRVKTRSL